MYTLNLFTQAPPAEETENRGEEVKEIRRSAHQWPVEPRAVSHFTRKLAPPAWISTFHPERQCRTDRPSRRRKGPSFPFLSFCRDRKFKGVTYADSPLQGSGGHSARRVDNRRGEQVPSAGLLRYVAARKIHPFVGHAASTVVVSRRPSDGKIDSWNFHRGFDGPFRRCLTTTTTTTPPSPFRRRYRII